MAPSTKLSHLDKMLMDKDENDPSNQLETLPILFTSHKNYDMSFSSFLESLKTGGDSVETNDEDFEVKVVVLFNKIEQGDFCSVKLLKLMLHYQMLI